MAQQYLSEEQIKEIREIYLDKAREVYENSENRTKAHNQGFRAASDSFPNFSDRAVSDKLKKYRDRNKIKEKYVATDDVDSPNESRHNAGDYEKIDGYYLIPYKGQVHKFPEDKIEKLIEIYSNWDNNSYTINQSCREIGAPRSLVVRILRVLGVTHDSAPFTPEELKQRDADDLWEDLKVQKEAQLEKKLQEYEQKQEKRELRKWRKFKVKDLNPLIDELDGLPSVDVPTFNLDKTENSQLNAHVSLQDFHFGGYGNEEEHGQEWNLETARKRLLSHIKRLIPKIISQGVPSRITVSIGGDYFHIDNIKGGTSHGTTMDYDESPKQIQKQGFQLAREFLEILSEVAPVHVVRVEGNHDRMLSSALVDYLCFGFEDHENINVESTIKSRHYETWGDCLIGYTHGFDVKEKNLHKVMSMEADEQWSDTDHRIFFSGHLHSLYADQDGILMLRCPSLSGTDEYHKKNGWIGATKSLSAFMLHKQHGWVGLHNTPVIN